MLWQTDCAAVAGEILMQGGRADTGTLFSKVAAVSQLLCRSTVFTKLERWFVIYK